MRRTNDSQKSLTWNFWYRCRWLSNGESKPVAPPIGRFAFRRKLIIILIVGEVCLGIIVDERLSIFIDVTEINSVKRDISRSSEQPSLCPWIRASRIDQIRYRGESMEKSGQNWNVKEIVYFDDKVKLENLWDPVSLKKLASNFSLS